MTAKAPALIQAMPRSDPMLPPMKNLITDVPGLAVGNAQDERLASGATAVIFDTPAIAAVDVRGGAPGTRETDLLAPEKTVGAVDALVLSGGSAFGLDAAAGVQAALAAAGRGFAIGPVRVPIVPGAILFDLLNGGDKDWGRFPPYRDLGFAAAQAAGADFGLGTAGAGYGATTADLKGGLGSASTRTATGHRVGALVAVNALGSLTVGNGPHFHAAPFEQGQEFGGRGIAPVSGPLKMKGIRAENTTIAVVATDAILTKAEARHLAVMAQAGLALAIQPIHTPLDGDVVFAAATGRLPLDQPYRDLALIGHAAALTLARACARAIFEAVELPFSAAIPSWKSRYWRD
jgi:L-aminopeptidase/D-esterase-like protein